MADIRFYLRNALAASGVVIKNGLSGAPALEQHADWPMSNLLLSDRYSYWRTSDAVGGGNFQVDFDLGSAQTIEAWGIAMLRTYHALGTPSFPAFDLYYATGSTYPPGAWTNIATGLGTGQNNEFDESISQSARFWRFDCFPSVDTPISCHLWLVKSADRLAFAHDWGPGTAFGQRRFREEVRSPSGLLYSFEPAEDIASDLRELRLMLPAASEAEWVALRDNLTAADSRVILYAPPTLDTVEFSLPDGAISASRRFGGLHSIELRLVEHP